MKALQNIRLAIGIPLLLTIACIAALHLSLWEIYHILVGQENIDELKRIDDEWKDIMKP